MLKKLGTVLMIGLCFSLVAKGSVFSYPMDTSVCNPQVTFGEFVKKAGCLKGEYWTKTGNISAQGEPVFACADGEVWDVYTNPVSGVVTVVLTNPLPDGTAVYSIYNGVSPLVTPGDNLLQADQIGTVQGDVLLFAIKTSTWYSGDKVWLKSKYKWTDLGGYVSPSLFIDLRSGMLDLPLNASGWTTCQVSATICRQMTYLSRDGDMMTFGNGLDKLVDNYGKYNGNSVFFPNLDGFIQGDTYEMQALKDGVTFHAYMPSFNRLDQLALADVVKMGTGVNAEVIPKVVGKTFKKANGVLSGYLVWKIKAKVAKPYQTAYGKSAMLYIGINPDNPLDRPFGLEPVAIGTIYWGSVPADFNWEPGPLK